MCVYNTGMSDLVMEKREAREAGERALESLTEARRQISGAKGLGVWDILGGGSFVSIFKHMKIERARQALERARYDLRDFGRELRDVQMDLNIEIGDFLTLFDLMDNFFADIMVQSRLSNAAKRIDEAIDRVKQCLRML